MPTPAAGTREEIAAVAERVAVACLGDNHLWQDLQLRLARRAHAR